MFKYFMDFGFYGGGNWYQKDVLWYSLDSSQQSFSNYNNDDAASQVGVYNSSSSSSSSSSVKVEPFTNFNLLPGKI